MSEIMKQSPLEHFATLARTGDEGALARLFEAGARWVESLCRRKGWYLPSGGDIEDLVQEGLIGLHEALLSWDPERGGFKAWAQLVIERDLMATVKTATRQKRQAQNYALSLDAPAFENQKGNESEDRAATWVLHDPSGLAVNPADLVTALDGPSELAERLFSDLTPLERSAVDLVCMRQMTYQAAAESLAVGDKALDNALQRAKRKILGTAARLAEGRTEKRAAPGDDGLPLDPETVSLLRRPLAQAAKPKRKLTEQEYRQSLPVELLRPASQNRYRLHTGRWILPPSDLLRHYPDIRRFAPGEKTPILEAYLAGAKLAQIAAQLGKSQTSVEHHLRRTVQAAAAAHGRAPEPQGPVSSPLVYEVDRLWRQGIRMKEIRSQLAAVATPKQVDAALAHLRGRVYEQEKYRVPPEEVHTRRVPLVPLNRIAHLLTKAKPLLIPEYVLTLKLLMLGYPARDIAVRREVADGTIGKTDLPLIRRKLAGIKGFEFLYSTQARERQHRLLWLESLEWAEPDAVEAVPEQHRGVMALWLHGVSEAEIATRTGLSRGTVKGRLTYCRKVLKRTPEAQERVREVGVSSAVRERKAAQRARDYPDAVQLLQDYGPHLPAKQRALLEGYFAGQSMTDRARAEGLEPDQKVRSRLWAQVKRTVAQLRKIAAEEGAAGQQLRRSSEAS